MSEPSSPARSPVEAADDHEEVQADVQEAEEHESGGGDGGDDGDEDHDSDRDSDLLSEIDENQFEDYDPSTAQIEERPVNIDEDVAKSLKASKRKRVDGEGSSTGGAKKPKPARREKKRRTNRSDDEGDDDIGGEVLEGKRSRKPRASDEDRRSKNNEATPEDEESLTPDERRRRAIERAMDAALKNPTKRRRKKDEVDLENEIDEYIAALKIKMENACMADIDARTDGKPAINKLRLLPDVLAVLNRNDIQETVLDPETNFLQSVKFFLEPLNDGSLPAYTIQRDIFAALTSLPIEKDALLSSGIGKVVLFYTRSKRVEVGIKRIAERLLGEWSRPILKRTDDYKKRYVETRDFDYQAAKLAERSGSSQYALAQRPAASQSRFEAEKARQLAPVVTNANRARPVGLPQAYTVAPKSTFDSAAPGPGFRPIGAGGMEAFRKMTQKSKGKKNN